MVNVRNLSSTSLPRQKIAKKAINRVRRKNRGLSKQGRGL